MELSILHFKGHRQNLKLIRLQIRVPNQILTFLFLNQNICCGYSKEPSQQDGSFQHLKQMFKLMDTKILTILRPNFSSPEPKASGEII